MRPMLKPALARVWRDEATLQIGLDPERSVVVGGVDPALARVLDRFDGTCELTSLLADAAGEARQRILRLVSLLSSAEVLDDASTVGGPGWSRVPPVERQRLLAEMRAVSVVRGGSDGGAAAMERRLQAVVQVVGSGPVADGVSAQLRAAGVGRVDQAGIPRPPTELPLHPRPELVVLAGRSWLDPPVLATLMREGVPHLVARLSETLGVVGPLVLPGRSSCLRCQHLLRAARDPAWPRVHAQLIGAPPPTAAHAVLAAAVAAHAALQALALIEGDGRGQPPVTVDGQLEIDAATGAVRRRSWSIHHACGCDWDTPESGDADAA